MLDLRKSAEDGVHEQVGQRSNAAGEDRFGKGTVGGKMVHSICKERLGQKRGQVPGRQSAWQQ